MRVIIVKFELKPEFREQFLQASHDDAYGSTHNEPGCLRFDVAQDEKDPNRIFFYEVYTSEAAFQEHLKTPHYLKWRDTISEQWYTAPPEVYRGWSIYPPEAEWR